MKKISRQNTQGYNKYSVCKYNSNISMSLSEKNSKFNFKCKILLFYEII